MNIGRGLFRLWLIASVVWVGACLLRFDFSCFFGSYPWCEWWMLHRVHYYFSSNNEYVETLALTFGVPIVAFIIGAAILWAVKGFQREKPSN
jgi:hypothetical protein